MVRGITLGRRERSPDDHEDDNESRVSRPRTAIPARPGDIGRMVIALHRTAWEVSTIREENADKFDLEDLMSYEIN